MIFWNGANGFDNARKQSLPCAAAVSVEVADLNGDGHLELIVANLWDKNPAPGKPRSFGGSAEADTLIYWGSAGGYSAADEVLPSVGNEDVTVADLNRDGKLDLVLTSYHAGSTRNAPSRFIGMARGDSPGKGHSATHSFRIWSDDCRFQS